MSIEMSRSKSKLAVLLMGLALQVATTQIEAQGVKGSGGSFNSLSSSNFGVSQPISTGGSLSSSFTQMFNQLTPIQQQQFIRQMSSSNKRVFQQLIQPQTSSFSSEEVSSSGGTGGFSIPSSSGFSSSSSIGGTKSGAFKSSNFQQNSVISPAQQAAFFRSQQSKSFSSAPVISQPQSQSFFSRQISSQAQPISLPSSSEFQSSRTVVNSVQPQVQPGYFSNQVQRVQQVSQPVVIPSSEQSFRRVQSFSSAPIVTPVTESGFTQQIVQQSVAPQPVQQSFNRFQQSQFSGSAQPVGFNQFSSSSSSSLAGGNSGIGGIDASTSGFSGALQQEKVDSSTGFSGFDGGSQFSLGGVGGTGGQSSFSSFNQQQSSQPGIIIPGQQSSSEFSSSGYEGGDFQQKNVADDFSGLTAASINNKWYIMKPVENPSALGLGNAASSNMRQVPLSRLLDSRVSAAGVTAAPKQVTVTTIKPKKRATGESSAEVSVKPSSGSSSLTDADDEETERK